MSSVFCLFVSFYLWQQNDAKKNEIRVFLGKISDLSEGRFRNKLNLCPTRKKLHSPPVKLRILLK